MAAASQTLSRGITALELLADAEKPLSIGELSERLGLHRSITYRIVRTLEEHGLVVRDAGGLLELGPRLAALARSVARDLQSAALPELGALAAELEMTAFLTILDGSEVVTLFSVEPRHGRATVAQRPGTRHSLLVGAPGAAIQSILTAAERAALSEAGPEEAGLATRPLEGGFATSHDEVIPGLSAIAVPLRVPGRAAAALAVVYVHHEVPAAAIAERLQQAAARIAADVA
ncbi:IclR family transcriptional regulator [Herbiconiux sp. YIM B11900]|uniref:IclR family transcriptional regulator n=1 Tax=Herbiconiux sp. YIM B11900 TaxID=3404131 RepID=UPI003F8600E1